MAMHLLHIFLGVCGLLLPAQANQEQFIPESEAYFYDTDYPSDFSDTEWPNLGGRLNQRRCIEIPSNLTLCGNIEYPMMLLPNLLDHDTLDEVASQASSWVPLTNVGCHPDTQLFLCSLFAPVCARQPVPPCRSLCESVRNGCIDNMLFYGFPWPEMLECDQFPLENGLCITAQSENKPNDSLCAACHHPSTYEAIVDGACKSEFAIKFGVEEVTTSGEDRRIVLHRKRKVLRKGTLKKRDLRDPVFFLERGAQCECGPMNDLTGVARRDQFLGMGNKVGDRLILTYLQRYDKDDLNMKRALRAMRRATICQEVPDHLTNGDPLHEMSTETTAAPTRRPRRGRKDRTSGRRRNDRDRDATTALPAVEDGTTAATSGRKRPRKPGRSRSRERGSRRDTLV